MTAAPRTRVQRRPVHGVVLLDKPIGLSSNQALQKVKWLLRAEKAGHTGTLDPLATGVLPLCFGAATKFSQLHLDADKAYVATLRLGQTTTTGDAEGELLDECAVQTDDAALAAVLQRFLGEQDQMPPMYSALKKDGKPLYEYARAGITVERPVRRITVSRLERLPVPDEILQQHPAGSVIRIHASVSKGSYIRTLAEDIGEALGCGAHLAGLRRIVSGPVDLRASVTLAALEAMDEAARDACLRPVDVLLADWPAVQLGEADAARFLSGMRRRIVHADAEHVRVYGPDGRSLLGGAHVKAGELIADRLLSPLEVRALRRD